MLDTESKRAAEVAAWLGLPNGTTVRIPAKDLKHYATLLVRLELTKVFRIYADKDRFQIWVPLMDDPVRDNQIARVFSTGVFSD
jgi:hypothetical protein